MAYVDFLGWAAYYEILEEDRKGYEPGMGTGEDMIAALMGNSNG